MKMDRLSTLPPIKEDINSVEANYNNRKMLFKKLLNQYLYFSRTNDGKTVHSIEETYLRIEKTGIDFPISFRKALDDVFINR